MTLPPEKIGDKGQRYVIKYIEKDTGIEKNFAYCNTGAKKLLAAAKMCPWAQIGSCFIVDRDKK